LDAIELAWKDAKEIDTLIATTLAEMPKSDTNRKLDPNDDVNAALDSIQKRKRFRLSEMPCRKVQSIESNFMLPPVFDEVWNSGHPGKLSTT
jgi:hypothetical protein